jgi:hypothetical protein
MRKRWKWIAVACALLVGTVLAVAGQGCAGGQTAIFACPDPKTLLYNPECCVVNGSGCDVPCVNPGNDLAVCCQVFAGCATDSNPDTNTNCQDWWRFWCAPDGGAASATTGGGGPTGCAGDCVPVPPFGWDGPGLFWLGPAGDAPGCPSNAPVTAYQGHTDPLAPDGGWCTACTCSLDGGSCSLPENVTARSGTCGEAGTFTTDFDPPAGWDGGCTDVPAIPAELFCGSAPCVASLTAGPLALTLPACTPSTAALVDAGLPSFGQAALACQIGAPFPAGCDGLACAPRASEAPDFTSCIFQPGVNECPAGSPYAKQYVVYSAPTFDDQRVCAPCTCRAPDSSCTATLDVFDNGACMPKHPLLTLALTSAGASCGDLLDAGPRQQADRRLRLRRRHLHARRR